MFPALFSLSLFWFFFFYQKMPIFCCCLLYASLQMSLAIQNVLSNYHDARMDMHGAPLFLGYIGLSFSIATLLEREKTERTFLYTRFIKWRKIFFIGSPIQSLYLFDYSLHYVCNLPILMRSSSSFFPWLMTRVIYPPFSMQYFIGCPLFCSLAFLSLHRRISTRE